MKENIMTRNFVYCVLFLLFSLSSYAIEEISVGMPREKVLTILGDIKGQTKYGKTEILYFYLGSVKLVDGKVASTELLTEKEAKERDYNEKAEKIVMSKFRQSVNLKVFQITNDGALCHVLTGYNFEHFMLAPNIGEQCLMGEGETRTSDLYWAGNYSYINKKNEQTTVNMYCLDKASAIKHVRKNFNLYDRPKIAKENEVVDLQGPQDNTGFDVPEGSGSGFFVSKDGYFLTNYHVIENASLIEIKTANKVLIADLIAKDPDNDLALLKVNHSSDFIQFSTNKNLSLGQTVFTVGFPMPSLQGFSPKVTKGVVSSANGMQDDVRMCQIDLSIQPGNSGGPLVDEKGDVVGIVCKKLDEVALMLRTGNISQNVNYALKKNYVLAFLDNHSGIGTEKQKTNEIISFEDAVKKTEKASAMVLVYKRKKFSDIFKDKH